MSYEWASGSYPGPRKLSVEEPLLLFRRIANVTFGKGHYPQPAHFQVTTAARLLDKAFIEWERARSEFHEHADVRERMPEELRPRNPGVTPMFFRAISLLESVVDALDRALRLVASLATDPALESLAALPLPPQDEQRRVRDFRNRIMHGDEDIAKGTAGEGPTATLWPDELGITIRSERIEYEELARMIEQLNAYLRAAIWK